MGRPLKYSNVEDMQVAIDAYFDDCNERKKPYTVTGLALALGFATRNGLLRYEKGEIEETDEIKAEYRHTIKKAKSLVEMQTEEELVLGKSNPIGKIFTLKNNYGWKDKTEVENTGGISVTIAAFGPAQIAGNTMPVDTQSSAVAIESVKVAGVYESDE
ncbi:terminase small subunit [Desulfovibrio gilichinskyi]|uniref:DNA-packaging protein gp3 n=1 Tax=Desulfovibrio gilichinskyi TaxID=1519643 RepID=A0A1X7C3L4_9BACT|nr:terminase small subunit [Desulfovibrio gilichinskyi]SME89365.1 DNA-packaging protein gp3 [Desulfovibrio gilichinskyi]